MFAGGYDDPFVKRLAINPSCTKTCVITDLCVNTLVNVPARPKNDGNGLSKTRLYFCKIAERIVVKQRWVAIPNRLRAHVETRLI